MGHNMVANKKDKEEVDEDCAEERSCQAPRLIIKVLKKWHSICRTK